MMAQLTDMLKVRCAQLSLSGVKAVNEDAIGIRIPEGNMLTHKGMLAVIADGVSAAEAGREASEACVKNVLYDYFCTPETWTIQKSMLAVLEALNRWLYSQGSHFENSEKGFITTLSVLIIKSSTAHIFHIGDSRIYRINKGVMELLTADHSRKVGEVTYLARAMGLDNKIQVDYRAVSIEAGDKFLLTTDGVHDFINDDDLLAMLATDDADAAVRQLVAAASQNGSDDNLSAQLVVIDHIPASNQQEALQNLRHLPFPPFLKPGQRIDGLLVERVLYESNRSQLYSVFDADKNLRYVMKTPSINYEDDATYIERFIMEQWLGRKFRHSKLVHVIQHDVQPTFLYYLMEYVEGVTLEEWLSKKPSPSLDSVVRIARQIGLGLRVLHRNQVIHQDLKPGNIMIDDNEQIKLLDFGSCVSLSMTEFSWLDYNDALGTASYSAPECHFRKQLNDSSDVFSLAVIIFEMLTGHLPYNGKLEKVRQESDLLRLSYTSVLEYNRYVPDWFDAALQKALQINPADRYSEVDEFIFDIEHPNQQLLAQRKPLLIKDQLGFWRLFAAMEMLVILLLCFYFILFK